MKTPSWKLLQSFVQELAPELLGAQLQNVRFLPPDLVLFEFYLRRTFHLAFSLHKAQPQMLLLDELPAGQPQKKPVVLFLLAHARNQRLRSLRLLPEYGRVLQMHFGVDENLRVEVHLIPHRPNILVFSGAQKISWEKPQILELQDPSLVVDSDLVSISDWTQLWLAEKQNQTKPVQKSSQRNLEKKQKAISVLEQEMHGMDVEALQEIGEMMKSSADLLPEQVALLKKYRLDGGTLSDVFAFAKKLREKKSATELRLLKLRAELDQPATGPAEVTRKNEPPPSKLRVRQVKLKEFWVRRGRNAEENLTLLREAKPWHWWLHLRDEPGAFAIILCERKSILTKPYLAEVAQWLIRESVRRSWVGLEKFSVVATRCQFVTPIRGDRKGAVTYTQAEHFTVASKRN